MHKGRERQKFRWEAPSWFLREREAMDEAMQDVGANGKGLPDVQGQNEAKWVRYMVRHGTNVSARNAARKLG